MSKINVDGDTALYIAVFALLVIGIIFGGALCVMFFGWVADVIGLDIDKATFNTFAYAILVGVIPLSVRFSYKKE